MGNITSVEIRRQIVGCILFLVIFFVFGPASAFAKVGVPVGASSNNLESLRAGIFPIPDGKQSERYIGDSSFLAPPCDKSNPAADCDGDGVTNGKEKEDGTDPDDFCSYKPECITKPQSAAYLAADCDGDGVPNGKEKEDGTDPLDSCSLKHTSIVLAKLYPSLKWKGEDCDGDGVTNWKEVSDKTDPTDPCDYKPESITLAQTGAYLIADCDGDGVDNGKELKDKTDPWNPCDFILAHQNCHPSKAWKEADCDGDGVPNEKEKEDGTDPLDPCSYDPASVTLPQTGAYLIADCDGDGVTNEKEKEDGTDPLDPCEFVLAHQTVPATVHWNDLDCDGDGVPNEKEKEDGTDPLDPCSYDPASVTLPRSKEWESLDCDNDGNPNITDPDPLVATARDDFGSTLAMTEVVIDILANDDFLPNNDPNNLGFNNLSRIGGTAGGAVSMDADTGLLTYIPVVSESNSTVTIVYQVCNTIPDPSVCATATVTIQVGANSIDAVDDGLTGTTDGGTIPGNVLSNDTLNGTVVSPADVVLTSTPTAELTIGPDGSISIAPGTREGTYTIDYTICEVADPANCDSATVTVTVEEDGDGKIEVNQLVTPNGDGKNDFLFIRGVKNAKNNTLQIFNRWGVAVYEGSGYNNQNNVFDGRSKGRSTISGNEYLPAGVYYYIFRYENMQRNVTDSGYIYVSK